MTHKNSADKLKKKLILYRTAAVLIIAFLLVQLEIVTSTSNNKATISLYVFALLLALPIAIWLDKYLVKHAKSRLK